MNLELKDETVVTFTNHDILLDAFNQICLKSHNKKSLDLTNFICGLIQFGINTLSNKQMENIFNLMDTNNESIINEYNFIHFFSTNNNQNENDEKLQMMLLHEIKQKYDKKNKNKNENENKYNKYMPVRNDENKTQLTESEFVNVSYIPLKSTNITLREYESEIEKLKCQLSEAITTLKATVQSNAEHIGENELVISELKYSLLKNQKREEQILETQEILIESSLEPTTHYNPFEWNINGIIDWLQMCNLTQYIDIAKINQINGNNLLTWNKNQLIHNFELKSNEINKFMQEIEILKETAPQIYDPNNVSVSSDSDNSDLSQNNNNSIELTLQETQNVTKHTFTPNRDIGKQKEQVMTLKEKIESQQNIISKINERNNKEINRLKSQMNSIETSKINLIINTSNEIQKLRDIINSYNHIIK